MVVTFINAFEVPADADDDFQARWQEVNHYMRTKPGYLDHVLHRSVSPDARFRFVNVAHWASAEDWRAAHDEGFRALVGRPEWARYPATPAVFDPVDSGSVEQVR
ncbi:MAG TPA: antibiotic biosynthesis monooxygenase family protein [Pseudonocardia sp.]